MFTESELKNSNKDNLVAKAMQMVKRIADLTSGPITADILKGQHISIKKQAVTIVQERQESMQNYQLQLAQINADKEKTIAKLQLEFKSSESTPAKELEAQYTKLEKDATEAKGDLTFGLEKAENEANIKLAEIAVKVEEAEQDRKDAIDKHQTTVDDLADGLKTWRAVEAQSHARKMEQLAYDNKKALRDENREYADKAAKSFNASIIVTDELDDLKSFKVASEKEIADAIELAVKAGASAIYATEGTKLSKLKNETDSAIALLQNDKAHLIAKVSSDSSRIMDLENQLRMVPDQIAKAVDAAKASIMVNQDAGKK